MIRRVELYLGAEPDPVRVGTVHVVGSGELSRSEFYYDPDFMYSEIGFDLAPGVRRIDGESSTKHLPLFLEDAGPDRWGERLLRRQARQTDELRYLDRFDCIVAASDYARQGALRFAGPDGEWLTGSGVPAQIGLDTLLEAADQVVADEDSFPAYAALLSAGTSALGGARPKATVIGQHGDLWMAKFPQAGDRHDVPLWEEATLLLSRELGIDVPESKLLPVLGRNVLLVRRFDRADGHRIPYQSFRTLLNNPDDGTRPPDYLHIASALRTRTMSERAQFLRRTILSIFINNTDDHLRNMGLLRTDDSWQLAPSFDVNPEPDAGKPRHTSIAGNSRAGAAADGLERLAVALGEARALQEEVERIQGAGERLVEIAGSLSADPKQLDRFSTALAAVRTSALGSLARAGA